MQDKLQAEIENLIKFKTKFRDTIRKEQADQALLANMNKNNIEHEDTVDEDSDEEFNNNYQKNKEEKKRNKKK